MKKSLLLIGGTGVVGSAAALVAIDCGFDVYTISLEKNEKLPDCINQYICDRNDRVAFRALVNRLSGVVNVWDIVFDIIGSKRRDAEQTCLLFGSVARRIFFLSTTLVYSRAKEMSAPIKSSAPLAAKGEMGGYVDSKVSLEDFVQSRKDIAWTILRPYHILGRYSLLGCLPDHNRDYKLVERIRNGEVVNLCSGGASPLNIVHPKDIASVVLKAAKTETTVHRAYNVVNPQIVAARDYYEEIAHQLGCRLNVESKKLSQIWEERNGWELTTFPHVYDTSDMQCDIGFIPSIGLQEAVSDALRSPEIKYEASVDIPVHNRMTLLPRPKRIDWLFQK